MCIRDEMGEGVTRRAQTGKGEVTVGANPVLG